jgi:hypothetical protein
LDESGVFVPAAEVYKRINPSGLVVMIEQRELAAQCRHDFREKALGLGVLREG